MAKGKDVQKAVKKEPLKTAKEKKAEKREKKNSPKRDQFNQKPAFRQGTLIIHKSHKEINLCELCAFILCALCG